MAEDGLATIRNLLAKPIDCEAKVVYLLVEVRKSIDLTQGRFEALKFFCDWMLHPRMEWRDAKRILQTFDASLERALLNPSVALEMMNAVSPLTSLRYFLNDLFVFLGLHHLDTSLVGNLNRWGVFLGHYVDIISRTPLSPKDPTLKSLDTIRVKKSLVPARQAPTADETFIFTIEWLFIKDSRERMKISNEVWFPNSPKLVSIPIARFENRKDGVVLVPQESQAFWKPSKQ